MPKLVLSTRKSWLWDSASILRGGLDSSDFKNYIFGLLFKPKTLVLRLMKPLQ